MSWIIITEEDMERHRRETAERLAKWSKEAQEKARLRESWTSAKTCPHCGQCPPLPPWLC
jgi:hypothetical protein